MRRTSVLNYAMVHHGGSARALHSTTPLVLFGHCGTLVADSDAAALSRLASYTVCSFLIRSSSAAVRECGDAPSLILRHSFPPSQSLCLLPTMPGPVVYVVAAIGAVGAMVAFHQVSFVEPDPVTFVRPDSMLTTLSRASSSMSPTSPLSSRHWLLISSRAAGRNGTSAADL